MSINPSSRTAKASNSGLIARLKAQIARLTANPILEAHKNATQGHKATAHKRIGSSRRLVSFELDQIAAMTARGMSDADIGKTIGISRQAVHEARKRVGATREDQRLSGARTVTA